MADGETRPLKVLQISHDYDGPFASICRQYCEGFSDQSVTTVYLRGKADDRIQGLTGGDHVVFLDLPPLRGFKVRSLRAVAALFRESSFDVVIAHRYKPIYLAGMMSYLFNIKLILGVAHEHDVFRRPTRNLFVTFWRRNIHVIAVSLAVYRDIAARCPSLVAGERLSILGHAVDPPDRILDRDPARAALQLPDDRFVFGCVGRLVSKKHHADLIDAFAAADVQDSLLVLVGDGPLAESLRHRAEVAGVAGRVRFTGNVDEAIAYYRAFDVFVLPSGELEAFGFVLLEAMLAGLPILASSASGPDDVLGDVGLRFALGDVDDLKAKMKLLFHDADARSQHGEAARDRYEQEFTLAHFVDRLRAMGPVSELKGVATDV